MRSKIRVDDKWYKPVPWLAAAECGGCSFDGDNCLNSTATKFNGLCDDGQEFAGMIFIPSNKEALANYIAARLVGDQDEEDE